MKLRSISHLSILILIMFAAGCSLTDNNTISIDIENSNDSMDTNVEVMIMTGIFQPGGPATITVNSEEFAYTGDFLIDTYTMTSPIAAGTTFDVTIEMEGDSATMSITMPNQPGSVDATLTDEVNQEHNAAVALPITWSAGVLNPDIILVELWPFDTVGEVFYEVELAGNATTHTIPGGTLKSDLEGFPTDVDVSAINERTFPDREWVGSSSLVRTLFKNESEEFTTPDN
jgi:hypothetical protein